MTLAPKLENAAKFITQKLCSFKKIHVKSYKQVLKFVRAVLWILSNGCRWRSLPECFGKWNTVYRRFVLWAKNGVWKRVYELCRNPDIDNTLLLLDSTIVKAHSASAGYKNREERMIGRTKGGLTTKISVITNMQGKPLYASISSGNTYDGHAAESLITSSIVGKKVVADRGYDSHAFREHIRSCGLTPVIPCRSNVKNQIPYDKAEYAKRNAIERFFGLIKGSFRRIATRYEKSKTGFCAFLDLAMAYVWIS